MKMLMISFSLVIQRKWEWNQYIDFVQFDSEPCSRVNIHNTTTILEGSHAKPC